MTTATQNYGAAANLTVTNLQSLADDAYWQSDEQDNSVVKGFWAEVFLTVVTNTSVGDANGAISLRMGAGRSTGELAGQMTGAEGSYVDVNNTDPRHTTPVASFSCDASEVTARTYKYRAVIHDLPEFFALLLQNQSGAALGAAGNEIRVRVHKYDSA